MDFLGLLSFFCQVLDLHNIVLRHEWINFLSFFVNQPGVLELGAQMQLQFDF